MEVYRTELADQSEKHFFEQARVCFHCGVTCTSPFVYWLGNEPSAPPQPKPIVLHPKCARKIALFLTESAGHAE